MEQVVVGSVVDRFAPRPRLGGPPDPVQGATLPLVGRAARVRKIVAEARGAAVELALLPIEPPAEMQEAELAEESLVKRFLAEDSLAEVQGVIGLAEKPQAGLFEGPPRVEAWGAKSQVDRSGHHSQNLWGGQPGLQPIQERAGARNGAGRLASGIGANLSDVAPSTRCWEQNR